MSNKIKLYLDNCSYNRPFDDRKQLTVRLEISAKLYIQNQIKDGVYELVWSYMNDYENGNNPYEEKREAIMIWREIANYICESSEMIREKGKHIQKFDIKVKDALHWACAISSKCEYFITTDGFLLKKKKGFQEIELINPVDFIREMENKNERNY
ncbi:MAG: hypothetical protein LBC02_04735 [Planctomycetaceae bacterium]|jgi:predicted nucleic acid-binding protein|nr:hypothetical protein [Planctomycetaceae bacterium]